MTNGEKLISDFPYIEIKGQDEVFTAIQIDTTGTGTPIIVYTEWWNAEYKESTKSKYEDGVLYFDCKDGVYGINTSSDRKGRFFPFPYFLSNGEIDWKKFKRHYNNVYEYVGEIIEADKE